MRLIITIFLISIFINKGVAQETVTIYFDSDWQRTYAKGLAEYYRVIKIDESGNVVGIIRDYYKTGELQWEGIFLSKDFDCPDAESCQFDGLCTWYHKNGKKSSEGNYVRGKLVGEEKNWDENGKPRDLVKELRKTIVSEDFIKLMIKSNIKNKTYDRLQGVWSVEHNIQLYLDNELIDSKRSNSQMGIVFLKDDYSVYNINQGTSSLKFFSTYDKNTFEVTIKDSGYTHKGTAKIVSDNFMKVVIEGNKSFIIKKYGLETARTTDIFFEMNFRKKYPLSYDFESILNEVIEEAPSTGSGFAIGSNYVVTNYHVVEKAKSITVKGVNSDFSTSFDAHVVKSDRQSDLAILQINFPISITDIPYSLKSQLSEVGEDIYVLGYPLTATMGEEIKLATGIISSQTGFQGSISQYQVSAPIQPGNSGSPLLDKNGNLIGVVSSKHLDTENVSYVVKSTYLRNLLDLLPDFNYPSNTLKGASLSDQVKKVKKYVYLIEINHE